MWDLNICSNKQQSGSVMYDHCLIYFGRSIPDSVEVCNIDIYLWVMHLVGEIGHYRNDYYCCNITSSDHPSWSGLVARHLEGKQTVWEMSVRVCFSSPLLSLQKLWFTDTVSWLWLFERETEKKDVWKHLQQTCLCFVLRPTEFD